MDWLAIAPPLTFLGVLITLWVTIQNSKKIGEQSKTTALLVERYRTHSQFQMACLDRRLQAHQEAFIFWSRLMKPSSDEKFKEAHHEASIWWDRNCLYLDPVVQQAFLRAISGAMIHHELVRAGGTIESLSKPWSDFEQFPQTLFEAIKFPPLSNEDLNSILKQFDA